VIIFPNCKINLGLNITGKRNDGYHNLETVFIPLNLTDVLEVISTENTKTESGVTTFASLTASGIVVTENPKENICLKAYTLLKNDFPDQLSSCEIHLHKAIPTGAGLGGGSADGAFTLKLLNQKFNLNLSTEQLAKYALQLGSDCPFFIYNKPCFAIGRGEIIEPVTINLLAYKFLLVNPGIHITTSRAFSQLTPTAPSISIKEIIQEPISTWRTTLKNDFEESVFSNYPERKKIKDSLYHSGAIYAAMSGSGSTVYGIFEKNEKTNHTFPSNYFVTELSML
jgi:4-diphosphocytidyl-2-C-methyl-D-erythritol kinase